MREAEAFEPDVGPARAVEEPDTVAEQHRRDTYEDLVEFARVEALVGHLGTEDVDILVAGRSLCRRDATGEVTHEGDTRHRHAWGVVRQHELRPAPAPAKGLAFLGRALVRVVAV